MRAFVIKIFSLITYIRHPKLEKRYKYYVRDNYYSRFRQTRFFIKDRVFKKRYKEIEWKGEFQAELSHVLPFAYWHFLNGTLKKTISAYHTKELYFFSPNHEERHSSREWTYNYKNNYEFPNMTHSFSKTFKKWRPVPLKAHYQNSTFIYSKPLLIIANKFNIEWGKQPVNYLSTNTLQNVILKLKDKFQIVYNRPLSKHIVEDNSEILDLNEHDWLKKVFPDVILLNELYQQVKDQVNNFNHLQLLVYSNCEHFVSVHGGTATLASYFGGSNIILSSGGNESIFDEYRSFFPKLSGAKIFHATDEQDVLRFVEENYM